MTIAIAVSSSKYKQEISVFGAQEVAIYLGKKAALDGQRPKNFFENILGISQTTVADPYVGMQLGAGIKRVSRYRCK
jgi:hypothetical protein